MQLITRLKENRDGTNYPFHMPGHKRRLADDELLGRIYGIDITETEGFDDLHNARGILKEAQMQTARLFGAYETHYLVNGSTAGLLAAINAMVGTGDSIVITGNCHRSVNNAVMLSGADPVVITPERECFGIYGGISPRTVKKALKRIKDESKTPHRTAVVITSPTYEGITSDARGIADVCHEEGAVLIVDGAHGAHFSFSDYFPESAIGIADIVVTSVHKTLPAMTQTSLLHIGRNCPDKERIREMLSVFMTSSPSYVLMASIDSMTHMLKRRRTELFSEYERRLDDFYRKTENLRNLCVLKKSMLKTEGSADHDRGRIVVSDVTGRLSGRDLSGILHDRFGIVAEKAEEKCVVLISTIADTDEGFELLTKALFQTDDMIK